MSESRIAFERPSATCAACGNPGDPAAPLVAALAGLASSNGPIALCVACHERIAHDGPPPAPFVPEFHFELRYALPTATADDLRALLAAIAAAGTPDGAQRALVAGAATPTIENHEAWTARVRAEHARPTPLDVAGLIVSGALLDLEPAPADELRELVLRARPTDELLACFGGCCARFARVATWRPDAPLDGRARGLLEHADRALLTATLPASHPLAARVLQIRIGVALALGKATTADNLLGRLGREDPRTLLLRGLRFATQHNHAAADRELRAATDSPFGGFDAEVDAAGLWNRAARALLATRIDEARDVLRAYCRLRPDDLAARVVLGHAFVRSTADAVAREVLESATGALRPLADRQDAEGPILLASCLLRLGEPDAARDTLAPFVAAGGERHAEVARLTARCALAADGDAERALDALDVAWRLAPSPAVAHEVAWAATAAARTRLRAQGIGGLLELVASRPFLAGALRKRYGALHALLAASHAQHQIRGGFRPQPGFGLEWSWIGAQGANARTATFQAWACLARHQLVAALGHDLNAQAHGAAPIPFATLDALFDAARRASPEELERLERLLGDVAQHALRELAP